MEKTEKKLIQFEAAGDIASVVIEPTLGSSGFVSLSVNDADSGDGFERPLIVGYVSKDTAVEVAHALLVAAGYDVRSGQNFLNAGKVR